MGYEIAITVGDKVLSVLPKFLLRRIYTKPKLNEQIRIDTRTTNPIVFALGTYVPMLNAWFTITNFTNLKWRVEGFSAEIWLNQPIAISTCFDRPEIRRKGKHDIFTKCLLSELQLQRLREVKERKTDVFATVYINAYLESKIGGLEFTPTLENRHVAVE